ncbi:unnamed protein product [Parajaminaea phylloscopi]
MHGVKRSLAPSASAREARKAKEAEKLASYLELEKDFFRVKGENRLDEEALLCTTRLLGFNPEMYTAWNYRRSVLSSLFSQHVPPPTAPNPDFFASARVNAGTQDAEGTQSDVGLDESQESILARRREAKIQLLLEDLELTQHALRVHPKVYWIWNHRKWCLIAMPDEESSSSDDVEDRIRHKESKWRREMELVNKMLDMDPRNFHGWDYRRFLLSMIAQAAVDVHTEASAQGSSSGAGDDVEIPSFPYSLSLTHLPAVVKRHHLALAHAELSYTLRKIESNFSNFSAWHQRSKVLPNVWQAVGKTDVELRVARTEEFDLLRQAIYTDPSDQSVWLYHAWLVSLEPTRDVLQREIESIEELLSVEPDSKWCIESLYRYKTLLSRQSTDDDDDDDEKGSGVPAQGQESREGVRKVNAQSERGRLCAEARGLLERLVQVDEDRAGRWRELLREVDEGQAS